ncbi:MAG: hypothetical protein ACOYMQ_12730 [Pseudanabaena sp.]|jgi:hypothetical protein
MTTTDDLNQRLDRIYAAIEAVKESDLSKIPPKIVTGEGFLAISQDFRGSLSDADLSNSAHTLIHNIANLPDHLKRWAAKNSVDKSKIDALFASNTALQIIKDLSNNDKHGYPPRNGGNSGKAPQVVEIGRMMQLSTGSEENSFVGFMITPDGQQHVSGSGSATVIVTGNVVDSEGVSIGDLYDIKLDAIDVLEKFMMSLGVCI